MKQLETALIADRDNRLLSALGYKQLNRIIAKAAEVHGTHRYSKDFTPLKEHVSQLVYSLIFDHNITKEQLSKLQRIIKVKNHIDNNNTVINLLNSSDI